MQNELDDLARSPWKLTASAVDNPSISNQDLERLLQFLAEVNEVLFKSFYPLQRCLRGFCQLSAQQVGDAHYERLSFELAELQDRHYYNVRLVCNRLHGLRDHAEKHIQMITSHLPNPHEWWYLFSRLDEREGFVENIARNMLYNLTSMLQDTRGPKDLQKLQDEAGRILGEVSKALDDIEAFAMLMHGQSDRIGFLALTDLSRSDFSNRLSRVYDRNTQQIHVESLNVAGDYYSGISNSQIINRSHVPGQTARTKSAEAD